MGNYEPLGKHIRLVDIRNTDSITDRVLGINIDKFFMPSVANVIGTDLSKYKLLCKGVFACNPMHVGRDERLPVALYTEDEPAIVSPAYFMFEIVDVDILDPNYLMMWFRRPEFDRLCWLKTDGSVRGGIAWDDICRLEVPVIPIEDQRHIVNNYNTISERIRLKQKINDNLDNQAKAIYCQMLNSEHSACWKLGTLGELLTVKYGKDHKHLSDGNVPLYGSGGIMRYVEKALYNKVSVLIPRKGSLNNILYVSDPFWSVDTMFYTELKQPFYAKYVYYFLRSKDFAGLDTGSAVPSTSSEMLNSMPIVIPDDEQLKQFDVYLHPLFDRMKQNNKEVATLKSLQEILLETISSR
ncbi:restriction endonuclease subunit S [Butyrivibrio sp. INlla16]|uniref:restriction endonuclease subunit S n=1 Tax=Butyrivibrio sp. INlla16 TaxID=1520807 RepID=UPI0008899FA8|nr:restriction endonuclease subunit S [Butyrivibrio sp. INlla16]SDB49896.1 type I restriction enzyme, S subunit [Butyrivibrio sp. INlla16]